MSVALAISIPPSTLCAADTITLEHPRPIELITPATKDRALELKAPARLSYVDSELLLDPGAWILSPALATWLQSVLVHYRRIPGDVAGILSDRENACAKRIKARAREAAARATYEAAMGHEGWTFDQIVITTAIAIASVAAGVLFGIVIAFRID